MVQVLAATALAVHGLIHLIGFVVPWRIAAVEGFPYRTTGLGGLVALGDGGARLVGVAWLVIAAGFVAAAIGTGLGAAWARPLAAALAVASIVVCVVGLPEAAFGVVVDAAILGLLGWLAVAGGRTARAPG